MTELQICYLKRYDLLYIGDECRAIVKHKAQCLNFPEIKINIVKRGGINFSTDVYAGSESKFLLIIRKFTIPSHEYLLCIKKCKLIEENAENLLLRLYIKVCNRRLIIGPPNLPDYPLIHLSLLSQGFSTLLTSQKHYPSTGKTMSNEIKSGRAPIIGP
jgi:hypothetical protein